MMTEEEYITLSELGDEYWEEFSKLIAAKLKKCPEHLRDKFLTMLQELSSVFGSKYDHYMKEM